MALGRGLIKKAVATEGHAMRALQRRRSIGRAPLPAATAQREQPLGVDDAWKTLLLVIDWIKHAEAKAGLTLSASGVLGGVLYTFVTRQREPEPVFSIAAILCTIFVVGAAASAGMVLRPILRSRADSGSVLFFMHIAQDFRAPGGAFVSSFESLVANPPALVSALAAQIWENSLIARRKYRWNSISTHSLLLALVMIAVVGAMAALHSS